MIGACDCHMMCVPAVCEPAMRWLPVLCRAKQREGASSSSKNQVSLASQGHICLPAFESLNLPPSVLTCTSSSFVVICLLSPLLCSFPRAYEKVLEEVDKCKAVLSACEQRDVKARQVSHAPNTCGGFVRRYRTSSLLYHCLIASDWCLVMAQLASLLL